LDKLQDAGYQGTVLQGHSHKITCISALADGFVSSVIDAPTLRYWQLDRLKDADYQGIELQGYRRPVTCISTLADGSGFVSGDAGGRLRYWQLGKLQHPGYQGVLCETKAPVMAIITNKQQPKMLTAVLRDNQIKHALRLETFTLRNLPKESSS
jgi:WD40 repeat protein